MTTPITIYLADTVHPTNQLKTFPYAAGCVGSYAASQLGERVAVNVFRAPEELGEAFGRRAPQVLGLTNYVWNLSLACAVLDRAKARAPGMIGVMGGPNYPDGPDAQRAFFVEHPEVDFYVYKEGEVPFLALVQELAAADFDAGELRRQRIAIPGVHYLSESELIAPPIPTRERELDRFPSPYLSGLLDEFFERDGLMPLLQTKRGCPFQCTFCVEGADYYTKLGTVSTERFRAELEYIAKRVTKVPVLYIADSNFGMYEHDLELCDVIADVRERYGWPETIEVSTGKNRNDRILEAVARTRGAMRFGPALESTDPQTLRNIKRSNISEKALVELAATANELGQRSFTELVLNLPGETIASHLQSIRAAMEAGVQRIKMYPLILLPGTEMASRESREKFGIRTKFRVLPTCHGRYRFVDESFPCMEIVELVTATDTMSFEDYLHCKKFELSVEIFYNDGYLHELHGLAAALGLSMFDVMERCHARLDSFSAGLLRLYASIEEGLVENIWDSRAACESFLREQKNLERYAATEYKSSLGTLKALALLDEIDSVVTVAASALWDCALAAGVATSTLRDYLDELVQYSLLRRRQLLDCSLETTDSFHYDFDEIYAHNFATEPDQFRMSRPRRMRFWHDEDQVKGIRDLCEEIADPAVRAREFIYPRSDPAMNPYLRRSAFV